MSNKYNHLRTKYNLSKDEFKVLNKRFLNLKSRCKHNKSYKNVEVEFTLDSFLWWALSVDLLNNLDMHISRLGDTGNYNANNAYLADAATNKAVKAKTFKLYWAKVDLNTGKKVMDFDHADMVQSLQTLYKNFVGCGLIRYSLTTLYKKIKRGEPIVDNRLVTLKLVECK